MIKSIALGVIAFALMIVAYFLLTWGFIFLITPLLTKIASLYLGFGDRENWVAILISWSHVALNGIFGGALVMAIGLLFPERERQGAWLAFMILCALVVPITGIGLMTGIGRASDWAVIIRLSLSAWFVFEQWSSLRHERRQRREREGEPRSAL